MDTERIELPNGNWWEIKTVVTRKMRKAFRAAVFQAMPRLPGVDLADAEAVKKAVMESPQKLDMDAIDDAYLLGGTVAYSYGEVNQETIDSLPEAVTDKVLARMRELYAELTEEKRKAFFGTP